MDADLQKYKLASESHLKNFTSEVLWRIRDAEELLKQRVSETRVQTIINELNLTLKADLKKDAAKNRTYLEDEINGITTLHSQNQEWTK